MTDSRDASTSPARKGAAPSDLPLALDVGALTQEQGPLVGSKAASLGALVRRGARVPEGFALTVESFRLHLESNGLSADVQAVLDRGGTAEPDADVLRALRERLAAAPLPQPVERALLDSYAAHFTDETPLAVRSSGTYEDLEGASFAGQYETILNVIGPLALVTAVKRCWASFLQPRVLTYLRERMGRATGASMGVAIQRLVIPEVAGVMFTVNPVTGRERELVIEAAFGLGEALVSGKVNADRFVLDALTGAVVTRQLAHKALRVVPLPEGGTREEPLDEAAGNRATLDDGQLKQLGELGAQLQEEAGRPLDVEWLFAGGTLYVVQSRPITRIHFAPDFGEWTTADFKDGGVSSGVCSPFMWSLYELSFDRSFPAYFKEIKLLARDYQAKWSQMYFARPYWNLGEAKNFLLKIPGFNERNFDTDLGVAVTYEGDGRTTPTTARGVLAALPVLFALEAHYERQLVVARQYTEAYPAKKAPFDLTPAAIAALDEGTFARRYRALIEDFYFETETTYFTTIYNTSNSKLDFKVHFDRASKACKGDLDYLKLVVGLEDLSHLRPMIDMHRTLAGLHEKGQPVDDAVVRGFAARWPHHGKRELDIRVPRWRDDLPYVREVLEQALIAFRPSDDPSKHAHEQHQRYLAEVAKARRALRFRPIALRSFLKKLERVRKYAWWREEMRDYSSRLYDLVRLWSVDAAKRLVARGWLREEDDLWHLRFQEALGAIDGRLTREEVERRVAAGRRLVRSFRAFKNPDEIGTRHDFAHRTERAPASADALKGIASSPGRVEARAKVVRSLEEAGKVQQGEILVATFTDPGWTPLFARLAGVVTETGGLLSHAAVISREYGIPAVLAVKGATRAIADGDLVVVDGTHGTVENKGQVPRSGAA